MKDELKKFGLVMAGAFIVLGILFRLKGHLFVGAIFALLGFLFAFFALVLPKALKPINFAWMKLSLLLGFVMSKVILGLAFFLIVTPIGLAGRIFGKSFLDLKINKSQKSYWQNKKDISESLPSDFYERQF